MRTTQFTPEVLKAMRIEMDIALKAVSVKFGIIMSTGNMSYSANEVSIKVKANIIGAEGKVLNRERDSFLLSAGFLGLKPEMLDQEFTYAGKTYKVAGLKSGRSKKCIVIDNLSTGKQQLCDIEFLKLNLK